MQNISLELLFVYLINEKNNLSYKLLMNVAEVLIIVYRKTILNLMIKFLLVFILVVR